MDEFSTEEEQVEQLKQWWHEYGWYLVGGMAVSAFGYFGWNQYQARQQARAEVEVLSDIFARIAS